MHVYTCSICHLHDAAGALPPCPKDGSLRPRKATKRESATFREESSDSAIYEQ